MKIDQFSVWRKTPVSDGGAWGGEKMVTAVSDSFVIIRNQFVSKFSPESNKEEVIIRSEFERNYVTTEEASRRISATVQEFMTEMMTARLQDMARKTSYQASLGQPAFLNNVGGGGCRYVASNGVVIRFTAMGHYYIEKDAASLNPVSSYDAAWIAAKSAELRKAYDAAQMRFTRYNY